LNLTRVDSSEKRRSGNRTAWFVLACFFGSGISGLIYQVVWVRELVLVFGATSFAASTVLTSFMCGLAAGSYYLGRRSGKLKHPIRAYALLELSIGIYGLLVPFLFSALPLVYQPATRVLNLSFFALSIIRFVLASAVLILPTTLMGATLPVLASFYAARSSSIGLKVGALYSVNTFGAMVGAVFGGIALMPAAGMKASTEVAAAINIVLGLVAFSLRTPVVEENEQSMTRARSRRGKRESSIKLWRRLFRLRPSNAEHRGEGRGMTRAQKITILGAFAASGFVALSYEVIWSRILSLIIGSSVYAFSIMLATFLAGLAIGGSVSARIVDRLMRPLSVFAKIEIGIGVTSLAGAFLFNELPYAFIAISRSSAAPSFGLNLAFKFFVSALVMIVPTILLGALFPLVVRIVYGDAEHHTNPGEAVGQVYAVNTAGAIVGAFISGFVLVPWLGLIGSLRVCVALNFVIAFAVFYAISAKGTRKRSPVAAVCTFALLIVAVFIRPPWNIAVMSSAVYRYAPSMSKMSRAEFFDYFKRGGEGETVYYKEGVTATVAVQKQEGGRVLKVNGKPDASTAGDLPTQILIGSLPLLLRQRTDNVLVIGMGSGVTLGSVEQFPIQKVTCVELEPAVTEATQFFEDVNNRPLDDKRLRLVANDGRNFIDTSDEKFDVIVSEPSNPWLTGVANLFTREYFSRGAARLNDKGLFSQWLQIYEMPPEDVRTLVATFRSVFPNVYLFRGAQGDLMLLGSKQSFQIDASTISANLRDQKIAWDARRAGVGDAADLLSRFYLGPDEAAGFATNAQLNTDDNALIEFNAPRRVGISEDTVERNVKELLAAAEPADPFTPNGRSIAIGARPYVIGDLSRTRQAASFSNLLFFDPNPQSAGPADFLLDMAVGAIKRTDLGRAQQFIGYSQQIRQSARAESLLGEIKMAMGEDAVAVDHWDQALAIDPNHFYTLVNLGKYHLMKQDPGRAARYLDLAIKLEPDSARAHHLRGLAYQAVGQHANAAAEYRLALPDRDYVRSVKTYYLNFGTSLFAIGLYEEAAQMLTEYTKLAPSDADGYFQLGAAYEVLAEKSVDESMTLRAVEALRTSVNLRPGYAMAHYYLSKAYRRLERYDAAEDEFDQYERYLAR